MTEQKQNLPEDSFLSWLYFQKSKLSENDARGGARNENLAWKSGRAFPNSRMGRREVLGDLQCFKDQPPCYVTSPPQ